MAQVRPYYSDRGLSAAYYDVVTAADTRLVGDIDLYASLVRPGGRILELGAGAGRVAIALAERGFAVTGVDLAPAMLAQAQAKRDGLPAEVAARLDFRLADMTALDLQSAFDLVVCPYFTLAHVPAGAAWRNTFAVAARHLPLGRLAAFHLPRLEIMREAPPIDPRVPVFDQPLKDGGRLRIHVLERVFREAAGRLDQVLAYVVLDPRGDVRAHSKERLTYYMADPVPLAAAAGLATVREPIDIGGVGDIHVFEKR